MRYRLILMLLPMMLTGCSGPSEPSLEDFKEKWYAAVNQRRGEELYHLLDARSRRKIDEQLERVRGLSEEMHREVINFLGGDKVSNLHELSNARYFALWWNTVTDNPPPTMVIEATGGQGATMMLTLNEQSQRIELKIEGGKWVWSLPEQTFELPANGQPGT